MGSQRRRLNDSLSAVRKKGFQGDGLCRDVGGVADRFGSNVSLSIEAGLHLYPSPDDLDILSDSSNSFMKRSGCEIWKVAVPASGSARAVLMYSEMDLQRAIWA